MNPKPTQSSIIQSFIIIVCALCVAWAGRLIPPLQSPDEHSHIIRAYLVSKGQWGLVTPPEHSSGHYINQGLVEFIHSHLQNTADPSRRFTELETQNIQHLQWQNHNVFYPIPGTGFYLPAIYLPQAIGWFTAQAFDLSVAQSYEMARSLNFIVSVILILWAYHLYHPPLPTTLMLTLPMSLFQLHQPTIDGLSHALLLLLLCTQARWIEQENQPNTLSLWTWGIGALILIGARLHALPLLACLLLLPSKKAPQRWWVVGVILCALTLWLTYATSHTIDLRVTDHNTSTERLLYYFQYPLIAIEKLTQTLTSPDLWLFYGQSWLGILGWLEVRLPHYYYWLTSGVLLFTLVCSWSNTRKAKQRLQHCYLLLGLFSTLMIFSLLLLTWTPLTSSTIEGVQGRYFLIPTVIASFAFCHGSFKNRETLTVLSLSFILNLFVMTQALWIRYH